MSLTDFVICAAWVIVFVGGFLVLLGIIGDIRDLGGIKNAKKPPRNHQKGGDEE